MTQLSQVLDPDALERQIAAGLITRRMLAGSDIAVYNYTARAAYTKTWTTETRRCRGLVVGGDGCVLARPFEKFFDLSVTAQPGGECYASEKVDGSLGILYRGPEGLSITTRGDPNGWQSKAATALWRTYQDRGDAVPPDGVTWLFEIVLPENRVVLDYGARRELVALAAIDIESGRDVSLGEEWAWARVEQVVVGDGTLEELVAQAAGKREREGFVLHWPDAGVRAKVKLADYVRRHRMIFSTSTTTIWEALAAGRDPLADAAGGPSELGRFVETHATALRERHEAVVATARGVVGALGPAVRADRRRAAEAIKGSEHPGLGFLALDGREEALGAAAWRVVRPGRAEMFHVEGAGE